MSHSDIALRHGVQTSGLALFWNQHNKSSQYNDSYLRDGSTFRHACFSFVLVRIITCQLTIHMSHSDIALRHGVQTSSLCLGINTTKVVNTMIPISAMAQLFDMLVSVLFL